MHDANVLRWEKIHARRRPTVNSVKDAKVISEPLLL